MREEEVYVEYLLDDNTALCLTCDQNLSSAEIILDLSLPASSSHPLNDNLMMQTGNQQIFPRNKFGFSQFLQQILNLEKKV